MHDDMPYGRNQSQGQGHSREVDRQSPTGLIFIIIITMTMLAVKVSRIRHCETHPLYGDECRRQQTSYIDNVFPFAKKI